MTKQTRQKKIKLPVTRTRGQGRDLYSLGKRFFALRLSNYDFVVVEVNSTVPKSTIFEIESSWHQLEPHYHRSRCGNRLRLTIIPSDEIGRIVGETDLVYTL